MHASRLNSSINSLKYNRKSNMKMSVIGGRASDGLGNLHISTICIMCQVCQFLQGQSRLYKNSLPCAKVIPFWLTCVIDCNDSFVKLSWEQSNLHHSSSFPQWTTLGQHGMCVQDTTILTSQITVRYLVLFHFWVSSGICYLTVYWSLGQFFKYAV